MIRTIMTKTRPYIPYTPFAAVAIVMVAIAVVALVRLARPADPPIHYTQAEYTPQHAAYAPGESLVYTPTLVIKVAGRVNVLRSYWNVTTDRNAVLCSGQPAPVIEISRNLPIGSIENVRDGNAVRLPVPDLPNGEYLLLSSAVGADGGQSVYQVRFKVVRSCGA